MASPARFFPILLLALLVAGCTTIAPSHDRDGTMTGRYDAPRDHHLIRQPMLCSAEYPQGHRVFIVVPDRYQSRTPSNYRNHYYLDDLPRLFRYFPRGSTVLWRNDYIGWDFPPEEINRRVLQAARAAGINLQSSPASREKRRLERSEPNGVNGAAT